MDMDRGYFKKPSFMPCKHTYGHTWTGTVWTWMIPGKKPLTYSSIFFIYRPCIIISFFYFILGKHFDTDFHI